MKEVLGLGDRPVIAGPCSAESEEQVLATAEALARTGVRVFRAGIWKPRTKPGNFEGVGAEGLPWLQKVKALTGMKTATEVATREHVMEALTHDVDLLWIGARTSANPFAMQEIADALQESGKDVTVLVKNPLSPDLELWIGALQRLRNAGVTKLGAIHRGFTSYLPGKYHNEPLWRVPLELRRRYPDLPLIFDPSHLGGKRELVAPLSQQALDMGFNGLIIESHCDPDAALSDRQQQITPARLGEILTGLEWRDDKPASESDLQALRQEIDTLDSQLIEVLAKRMDVSRRIGDYKKSRNIPVVQPGRYSDVLAARIAEASARGLDPAFIRSILSTIHEESVRVQVNPD